jgi:hypothetical protein
VPSLLSRTSRKWEDTPRRVNSFLVRKVPEGATPANWARVLSPGAGRRASMLLEGGLRGLSSLLCRITAPVLRPCGAPKHGMRP